MPARQERTSSPPSIADLDLEALCNDMRQWLTALPDVREEATTGMEAAKVAGTMLANVAIRQPAEPDALYTAGYAMRQHRAELAKQVVDAHNALTASIQQRALRAAKAAKAAGIDVRELVLFAEEPSERHFDGALAAVAELKLLQGNDGVTDKPKRGRRKLSEAQKERYRRISQRWESRPRDMSRDTFCKAERIASETLDTALRFRRRERLQGKQSRG
jgi:hypothetical protein